MFVLYLYEYTNILVNREIQQLIPYNECLPMNWSCICAHFP